MAHIIPHPLVELCPQVQPAVLSSRPVCMILRSIIAGGSVCMVPYGRATACTEGLGQQGFNQHVSQPDVVLFFQSTILNESSLLILPKHPQTVFDKPLSTKKQCV